MRNYAKSIFYPKTQIGENYLSIDYAGLSKESTVKTYMKLATFITVLKVK